MASLEAINARLEPLSKAVFASWKKTNLFIKQVDTQYTQNSEFFKQLDSWGAEVKKLQADVENLKNGQEKEDMLDELREMESRLSHCQSLRPRTGSRFIQLFFGKVNCVVISSEHKLIFKDEYVKFRKRMTFLYVVFPLILMNLPKSFWVIDTLWHLWLLFYYVSHALRENYLKVNGSQIKRWWAWHHYFSIIFTVVVLTFPMCEDYTQLRHHFQRYAVVQGLVQMLSDWYQQQRLYKTRALGRATAMDVPDTDTMAVRNAQATWRGLLMIVPFFFGVQALQFIAACYLLAMWWEGGHVWQVAGIGIGFLALGTGNFATTVKTLLDRRKERQEKKKAKRAATQGAGQGAAHIKAM